MSDVLYLARLIVPLALGIALGCFLRNHKHWKLDNLTSGVILVLIFCLGFAIGSNGELLAVMPTVGYSSIVLLIAALFFSIFFVKAVRKLMKI